MLNSGSIVGGRYQIVRAIGQGGMGEVYEAVQVQLARRVALKTIREDLAKKPELLTRFRREAESAAALGHPNLVQVTDFYDAPGEVPFLVMEMLDGSTLKEVLEREGRLDPGRAVFIGVQLLSGLAAAHRANIVHRDVKPGNIFLQSTSAMRDLVKVLDFGVAKLALEALPGGQAMTQAGEVLGTIAYMAPEQGISGAAIDGRTDIFAVGATLFHALAGVRPFDVTELGVGRAPLDRVAPWVSRDLAAIIERALSKSPDARWASADEMAAALQPFATGPHQSGGHSASAPPAAPSAGSSGGWNPVAIGRMEAPTGGSMYGNTSMAGGPAYSAQAATAGLGYAPTGYAPGNATGGGDPSVFAPRDATLLGHGARAPGAHVPGAPIVPQPAAFAPAAYAPNGVSGAVPAGAVPYARPSQPSSYPQQPPSYPQLPNPQPMAMQQPMPMQQGYGQGAPPKKSPPYWLAVPVIVALLFGAPYLLSFLAIRNATNPDTIATNVEKQVLLQPKQPCPTGDSCTQQLEEHGLTYPLCTRRVPKLSPYRAGEMVVAGDDKRIALVSTDLGNGKYEVRFLTGQKVVQVNDEDIAGRLCRAGSRGGTQTVP